MKPQQGHTSWIAFAIFYLVLVAIVTILDFYNTLLTPSYWAIQVGLITLGVGTLALVGFYLVDLTGARGIFLAFTISILTIIPAVLMVWGTVPGFWQQYFSIAFGLAAGSFLTYVFLRFGPKRDSQTEETEFDQFD